MMRRKGLLILGLGIIGLVAVANAARHTLLRQPLTSADEIIFAEAYTLSGSRDSGLVLLAERVHFQPESRARGDVALVSATIRLDGLIDGDLTVLAERVEIGRNAVISGNATLLADEAVIDGQIEGVLNVRAHRLELHESAQIAAEIYACRDSLLDMRANATTLLSCDESDLMSSTRTLEALSDPHFVLPLLNITLSGAAVALVASALASLALSGLSILAVIIFPRQISHIEEAIRQNPRGLGGTGLMMLALAAGVSVALALLLVAVPPLGFVVVPVYLLLLLIFAGMALAGWITITLITGDLILSRLGIARVPPLVIAAAGNVALLLGWNLLALNDYSRLCGLIALLLLGSVGLGATFITRLGTRPVHRSYLVQG